MLSNYDFDDESPRPVMPAVVAIVSAAILFLALAVLVIALARKHATGERQSGAGHEVVNGRPTAPPQQDQSDRRGSGAGIMAIFGGLFFLWFFGVYRYRGFLRSHARLRCERLPQPLGGWRGAVDACRGRQPFR